MTHHGTIHEFTTHDGPDFVYAAANVAELAQARVASQIVFMEVTGRQTTIVARTDPVVGSPGAYEGTHMASIHALTLPRNERQKDKFLFSTRPWTARPTDPLRPNQYAEPRIITAGKLSQRWPVDPTARRRGQRTIADASLANPDGAFDNLVSDYEFEGEKIEAWIGELTDDADQWVLLYSSQVDTLEATRKIMRFGITTLQTQLKRQAQLRKFTGGGGITGDAGVAGRNKPMAWGSVWGAAPVLGLEADNIYFVRDDPVQGIDNVYEGGLPFTNIGDVPTLDALIATSVAVGEYATCNAEAAFKPGTTPAGLVHPLRVVFRCAGPSSTGEILYEIARDRAFISANDIDLATFQGLPGGTIGYYNDGSTDETCEDIFNRLVGGVAGVFGVGRGQKLICGRLLPPENLTPAVEVTAEQIFNTQITARPDKTRSAQPYTYAPTANPVNEDQVFAGADATIKARLTQTGYAGVVYPDAEVAYSIFNAPNLPTYFALQSSAQAVATNALGFVSKARTPFRADLGRVGLAVGFGDAISMPADRFEPDFVGTIYEIDENFGAVVTAKVATIG